jgi:subtilisin
LDQISCLCLSQKAFENYGEHFLRFNPFVEENIKVSIHAKNQENIPWGISYEGADRLWQQAPGKGSGVKVAVIDTGISRSHPDLRKRVKGGIKLAKSRKLNGHGTHVAGIIAASLNNKGVVGMAPEADLYDVRAFCSDGTAELSDIIRGIDWSIQNGMDIINMSFCMAEPSEALSRVIKKARAKGIKMVASAGNNGGAVEYPAKYTGVIGVGAIDKNGSLADFSSRGSGVDAKAPGVGILSTWTQKGYKTLEGTSMAAPHVAGKLALQSGQQRENSPDNLPQAAQI